MLQSFKRVLPRQFLATVHGIGSGYVSGALRFFASKPLGAISGFLIAIVVFLAIAAPIVSPFDPLWQYPDEALLAPSLRHLMGTDNFGRDILSNIFYGARVSMIVGFVSVVVGTGIGALWGLFSGYLGGKLDILSQRLIDILLAIPALVLALILVAGLGSSLATTIIAISIVFIPPATRVVRGSAIAVRQSTYVDAARSFGCSDLRIALRHVMPNCLAPWLIVATTSLGRAILLEASLSFLGVGIPPPHPSWGRMLSGIGRSYMMSAPWISVFPGLAITITVLAFNLFGDALRDVWDPRLRGSALRPARGLVRRALATARRSS